MPGKTVTLKDIAERCGVSATVVSAVLNHRRCRISCSEERREQIFRVARELNFQPNLTARRLRSGRSRCVGVLFPSFRDRIIAEIMNEIYRELQRNNYTGIFAFWEHHDEVRRAYDSVMQNNVDGIISCEYHPEWIGEKLPAVIYGETLETDSVFIDYENAFQAAVNYLFELGHRSFGYIGSRCDRGDACRRVLFAKNGIRFVHDFDGMGYPESGIEGIRAFNSSGEMPTAILCHNDSVAMAAMAEAQRAGLTIGRDLSLIGFDNIEESAICHPRLTTIDSFLQQKSSWMVNTLLKRIEHTESPYEHLKLHPQLIVRDSCGPVNGMIQKGTLA